MRAQWKRRSLGFFLALALLAVMGVGALASSAPAGDQNYVSMHNYMSKTDIPNVFKGTLSLQTPPVAATKGPVYVAITLDYSGSMNSNTLYDSSGNFTGGAPGTISAYKAMEAAVEATIDSLIADGNKQIYINLSTHDGNSIQGFNGGAQGTVTGQPTALNNIAIDPLETPIYTGCTSLYDKNGDLRKVFDKSDAAWIMKDWNNGVNWGGVGTPMPGSGWCGYYDMNDYAYPFWRIHKLFKDGLLNGRIPTYAAKYGLCPSLIHI